MQKHYKENHLKSYAIKSNNSMGRIYNEPENLIRSPYQRDRDRIIHSTAFRRLKHKTQVFVNTAGDHYRTRITHSLEVSQIARTLSKYFLLNWQQKLGRLMRKPTRCIRNKFLPQ